MFLSSHPVHIHCFLLDVSELKAQGSRPPSPDPMVGRKKHGKCFVTFVKTSSLKAPHTETNFNENEENFKENEKERERKGKGGEREKKKKKKEIDQCPRGQLYE